MAIPKLVLAIGVFSAHTVGGHHRHSVGYRMALHGALPNARRIKLIIIRFAAVGGGIKQNICTLQRHRTRALGEPLVPANAHTDIAKACFPRYKTRIAMAEMIFILVTWAIRNVALTVHPHEDRKSTRLNSSHVSISYAVFCL